MDALDAPQKILREAAGSLHYKEITTRILELKLWQSEAQKPSATINSGLAVDIKKYGTQSRFIRTAPGIFGLREWGLVVLPAVEDPFTSTARANDKYSFTNAAEIILKKFGENRPMHYRDITWIAFSN